ncbi:hypothetical protein PS664_03826 [Pseudomonas fluorescens]|nr:hypothetical protein PS664_03826 [Pseudomonas fluorescens]
MLAFQNGRRNAMAVHYLGSGVKLYANYSAFDKSADAFKTSQRLIRIVWRF